MTVDAALVARWLRLSADVLTENTEVLTDLDAARGDADHGVTMAKGFRAMADALAADTPATAGDALLRASAVLRRTVGGTSGVLWSVALHRAGKTAGDADPLPDAALADALAAAADGIAELGGAREGDATMLDALLPATRLLRDRVGRGDPLPDAVAAAAEVATDRARATANLVAGKGRASYLGERVLGRPDPGAVSAALVVTALRRALSD